MAVEQGLVGKNGAWFTYNDTRIGQGRENAKTFLQDSAEITTILEAQLRQGLGLASGKSPLSEPPPV
jgi:recombination protein RecA